MPEGPYRDRIPALPDRYFCEQCRQRYAGSGMCPEHPDEPLLDLTDPEVRLLLEQNDVSSRRERAGLIGVMIGGGLYLAVMLLAASMGLDPYFAEMFAEVVGMIAVIGIGIYVSNIVVTGPKPVLDETEIAALEEALRWREDLALPDKA